MAKVRFSVSMDRELLKPFEAWMKKKGYKNRSEALRDLIRRALVEREWEEGKEVAGVVVLLYDHRSPSIHRELLKEEHSRHQLVIAKTHTHLNEENCLEVVILRGRGKEVKSFGESLITRRGVKFGRLVKATTGKTLK